MHVDSRAQDLLDAGKVALEAMGEDGAAANMKCGPAAVDSIKLEVTLPSPIYIYIYMYRLFIYFLPGGYVCMYGHV